MVLPTRIIDLCIRDNDHVKRLKDPLNPTLYHLETWLPFGEAIKLEKGNANVRPAGETRKPFKDMISTVQEDPASFHFKNRGITYLCERFEYDNARHVIRVTIPDVPVEQIESLDLDEPKFGVADGGHTYEVIRDTVARQPELMEIPDWTEPFVRVHFIASQGGFFSVDEVVEALNTSSQVQQFTMDEFKNKFDDLKRALQQTGFDTSLVAFRENEDKEWDVREIIQRLACFLKDRWKSVQPSQMYRSKGRALALFTADSTHEEFIRLYPVATEIVTLPEYIQSEFSKGEGGRGKKLGNLRAVKSIRKTIVRPGTPYETEHVMDLAATLPIAAAFRELLELRDGVYQWKLDPRMVFKRCAEELYRALAAASKNVRSVTALGADNEYWMQTVNIVLRTKDDVLSENRS